MKDNKNKHSILTSLEFATSSQLVKFSHPAIKECCSILWYDKLLRKNKQFFNTWLKVT